MSAPTGESTFRLAPELLLSNMHALDLVLTFKAQSKIVSDDMLFILLFFR